MYFDFENTLGLQDTQKLGNCGKNERHVETVECCMWKTRGTFWQLWKTWYFSKYEGDEKTMMDE